MGEVISAESSAMLCVGENFYAADSPKLVSNMAARFLWIGLVVFAINEASGASLKYKKLENILQDLENDVDLLTKLKEDIRDAKTPQEINDRNLDFPSKLVKKEEIHDIVEIDKNADIAHDPLLMKENAYVKYGDDEIETKEQHKIEEELNKKFKQNPSYDPGESSRVKKWDK